MDIKLMKTSIHGLQLYKEEQMTIDFITTKKVSAEEVEERIVEHLFGSVYKQNVLAFAGINASGKTTTLKLITMMLELFIQNKSLENLSNDEVLEHLNDRCTFVNTFYFNQYIYELTSEVARNEKGQFDPDEC